MKPSDKYRERLTANANDFDSIVAEMFTELDTITAEEECDGIF